MKSIRTLRAKTAWKQTAPAIFLVMNSFVWYILTNILFGAALNNLNVTTIEKTELFGTYFASMALSALVGAKFFPRRRTKLLNLWLLMGIVATFFLITISTNGLTANALLAIFLGASIGVGLPSCLSYFADSTTVENRGLIGGIIWSGVGFVVLALSFLIGPLPQWETVVALALWRLLGTVGFPILNRGHVQPALQKSPKYLEIVRKREILLYWFPWVMFALINFAETPILDIAFNSVFGPNFFEFLQLAEFAFIGIFAIMGGAIADKEGRKKVVIAGFIMLGIEYAMITVFSISLITGFLFLTLDGITWGLLFSVFFTVLWGDLGENREKEKYYTIGGLPYLLAGFLPILISPYAESFSTGTAFSLASFFLFLAVIPLMYAPETLPEKTMKDRDLKSYLEKAQKLVQKKTEKNEKRDMEKTKKEKEEENEETQESPEDEEARKLAEKYY